jgi:hypothetical protein
VKVALEAPAGEADAEPASRRNRTPTPEAFLKQSKQLDRAATEGSPPPTTTMRPAARTETMR